MQFYPEGVNDRLSRRFDSFNDIKTAMQQRALAEATVLRCDENHNLYVDLGCCTGIIPKNEGALGILEGTVRDIALISKVGRRVCFYIMGFQKNNNGALIPVLSRRRAQLDCKRQFLDTLLPGDIIRAKVTRLEPFGAFIDIGCGINSLIPIDMLSVSRIAHPCERLQNGQLIRTALLHREPHKLTFTLKELLGTWEENAAAFRMGETVTGTVRSVEDYGVFVELAPNLAGLAELCSGVMPGERVSVYIKSVIPEKMKIKLVIVERLNGLPCAPPPLHYFVSGTHTARWEYSPPCCAKHIATVF